MSATAPVSSNPAPPTVTPPPIPLRTRRAPTRRRFRDCVIPGAPALCPPPCRTLLLLAVAYREDDAPDWRVHFESFPVLAVESSAVAAYRTLATPEGQPVSPEPANHEQATYEGWWHQWSELRRSLLFADVDGDIMDLDVYKECNCVDAAQVVACPWPAAEDGDRLEAIKEEMRGPAIEHARVEARG